MFYMLFLLSFWYLLDSFFLSHFFFQGPENAQRLLAHHRCHLGRYWQIYMCNRQQLQHQRPCGSAVCSGWVKLANKLSHSLLVKYRGAHRVCAGKGWRCSLSHHCLCHPSQQVITICCHVRDATACNKVKELGTQLIYFSLTLKTA